MKASLRHAGEPHGDTSTNIGLSDYLAIEGEGVIFEEARLLLDGRLLFPPVLIPSYRNGLLAIAHHSTCQQAGGPLAQASHFVLRHLGSEQRNIICSGTILPQASPQLGSCSTLCRSSIREFLATWRLSEYRLSVLLTNSTPLQSTNRDRRCASKRTHDCAAYA